MYILIILNLLCTWLCYKSPQKGLKWAMLVLFAFLALRYKFGNDYEAYEIGFRWSFSELREADVEIGYAALVDLFHRLGFQAMVAFLSGVFCFSLYKTIDRYVDKHWQWLVVFSIISNADLIFIGSSAIRQTAAMSFIMLSLPFLERRDVVRYSALIALAVSFHMSATFFFLLIPLMYMDFNSKRQVWLFGIFAIISTTLLKTVLYQYIGDFTESNLEKYAERYGRGAAQAIAGGYVGLAIRSYIAYFMLHTMIGNKNRFINISIILSVLSFVIFSMREQVMLQRFTMYFGYFTCFILPVVLENTKSKQILGDFGYKSLYAIIILWNISMVFTFVATADETYIYQTIFPLLFN